MSISPIEITEIGSRLPPAGRVPERKRTSSSARGRVLPSLPIPFVVAALFLATVPSSRAADDLLSEGNAAYREGDLERAVEIFEDTRSGEDYLTRRFNAGVALLDLGRLEEAIERFEEVETQGPDRLARLSRYNLGYCHFRLGERKRRDLAEDRSAGEGGGTDDGAGGPGTALDQGDDLDRRIEELRDVAASYRNAVSFYRRVEPADEDTEQSLLAARTSLLAIMDEIHRLEEEKRRREEERKLEKPSELIRELIAREKLHRTTARSLAEAPAGRARVAARALHKAEAENRSLTEKLAHRLERDPEDAGSGAASGPSSSAGDGRAAAADLEKERRRLAASALRDAIQSQKDAERAYDARLPADAVGPHGEAIHALREARKHLPLELDRIVREAIAVQENVLRHSRAIEKERSGGNEPSGGAPEDAGGSGIGKIVLEALQDKVLRPLAGKLAPSRREELRRLAEEEEEVVWAGEVLSEATIQPGTPAPAGAADTGGPRPTPSPEEARALEESVRADGEVARKKAREARAFLEVGEVERARPAEEEALAALRRIADLLPKPPEPPEAKLRELIARQRDALETTRAMEELPEERLSEPAGELAERQRADGRTGEEIAGELESRQDDRARRATPLVREGAERIFSSSESLASSLESPVRDPHDGPRAAAKAIEEAVERFEKALAILSGREGEDEQRQDKERSDDERKRGSQGADERPQVANQRRLTPRQARMLREEMDRKRREEEEKLFSASSSVTVEKDW